eukprot:11742236-Karenia_brevis.AAC.1
MLVSKNQRKQQLIGRLQISIDNLKAKIQDKDDIIYGLRCKLAASAGHASPVLFDVPSSTSTSLEQQQCGPLPVGHATPVLFHDPSSTSLEQQQCGPLPVGHATPELLD